MTRRPRTASRRQPPKALKNLSPRAQNPRPLPLLLSLALLQWLSWPAALPTWKSSDLPLPLNPEQRAQRRRLLSDLKKRVGSGAVQQEKLKEEIAALAGARYKTFLDGIRRYQAAAVTRTIKAPKTVWREGTTRLLDFGGAKKNAREAVLVIPSLINRYHVLDIERDVSFLRALLAQGFRPLLVDWGEPGRAEADFTLDHYISRLQKALALAHRLNNAPVKVIGYCMGGLMAMGLATLEAKKIDRLVFLATPWDFHAGSDASRAGQIATQLVGQLDRWGELPVDVMHAFFIMIAPFAVLDKFTRFAALKPGSAEAASFVLLEDWVNDGVPLPKHVARDCLDGWYSQNTTRRGTWHVHGARVNPSRCSIPSLHVIPSRDRIVPPKSAAALAALMPHAHVLHPPFGHVSMMAHRDAAKTLWPQIFDWLASPRARH